MDRRHFLNLLAGGTGLLATRGWTVGVPGSTSGTADPLPPLAWLPTSLQPALTHVADPNDVETNWNSTSVLPAGVLLGSAAIDEWYLFRWTHDTSHVYLYTAPAITGPYTMRGFGEAPTPYPSGYIVNHFSAADIVWDTNQHRFLANPHGVQDHTVTGNAEPMQDSFLISSTDGLHWEWLDGDNRPRLRCGGPGTPDGVHTGYGRLLRDIDGNIATHQGRYWWIYRAQQNDAGQNPFAAFPALGTKYTPYLASAPDLQSDFTGKQKAFDSLTANLGLFGFGCFFRAGGRNHTFLTQGLPDPPLVPSKSLYYRTSGDNMAFGAVPLPFLAPTSPRGAIIEESNVIRDPATGKVYLVQTAASLNVDVNLTSTVEVWVYEGLATGSG